MTDDTSIELMKTIHYNRAVKAHIQIVETMLLDLEDLSVEWFFSIMTILNNLVVVSDKPLSVPYVSAVHDYLNSDEMVDDKYTSIVNMVLSIISTYGNETLRCTDDTRIALDELRGTYMLYTYTDVYVRTEKESPVCGIPSLRVNAAIETLIGVDPILCNGVSIIDDSKISVMKAAVPSAYLPAIRSIYDKYIALKEDDDTAELCAKQYINYPALTNIM